MKNVKHLRAEAPSGHVPDVGLACAVGSTDAHMRSFWCTPRGHWTSMLEVRGQLRRRLQRAQQFMPESDRILRRIVGLYATISRGGASVR